MHYVFEIRVPKKGEWIWDKRARMFALNIGGFKKKEYVLVSATDGSVKQMIASDLAEFFNFLKAVKNPTATVLDSLLSPDLGGPL